MRCDKVKDQDQGSGSKDPALKFSLSLFDLLDNLQQHRCEQYLLARCSAQWPHNQRPFCMAAIKKEQPRRILKANGLMARGCHFKIRLWMLCLVCKSLNERHSTSKDRGNVDLCTCNLGIWQMDVPTCRKTWRVAANDQPLPAAITREACMTCSTIAHTAYSRETVGRLSRTDGLEPIWLRATEKTVESNTPHFLKIFITQNL